MTEKGYIKYYRASTENALYFAEPFTKWQAWTDLLLLTNHKRNAVSIRGNLVTVEAGQVLAGEDFLADRWKWSRGKVRRFLNYLSSKTVQQIVQQKNHICSLYTITNWTAYQTHGTADDTTDGQQTVQQTDNRRYTPKNVKNDKNEEEEVYNNPAILPHDSITDESDLKHLVDSVMAANPEVYRFREADVLNAIRIAQDGPERARAVQSFCATIANTMEPIDNAIGKLRGYMRNSKDFHGDKPESANGQTGKKLSVWEIDKKIEATQNAMAELYQKHYFQTEGNRSRLPDEWQKYLGMHKSIQGLKKLQATL